MSSIDYGVSPDALLERIAEKEQEIAELKNRLREWEDGFARTPSREANFTSVSGAEVAPLYTPLDRPEPGSEEAGYYLDRIGLREEVAAGGLGPILASTHARFRAPLTYPDTVHVGARVSEVGEDRFTMEYRVVSEKLGTAAADGGGVLVSFDYRAGRKAPLPAEVRSAIEALEASAPGRASVPTR